MALDPWEARWAPYDEATYAAALAAVSPTDIVLEIGAGDLRLARRLAAAARQVIAWEIQADVLAHALSPWATDGAPLPPNLAVSCTDARTEPIPPGVTVAVLLMRHCTQYRQYVARLRAAGCQRLITNARWRMGVEVIDLHPGAAFASVAIGWYACRRCGATGFVAADASAITESVLADAADVEGCPQCEPSPYSPKG